MDVRAARLVLGIVIAVAVAAPRPAAATSEGTGLYVGPTALPWVANRVTIDAAFGLARGEVEQRFWNNLGRPVEAVYVFPLPTGAVVTSMSIEVDGRRIDAVIARRAEAVARYERAIASGHAAALTERERPGVYTQSIAGIPIEGQVVVTLRWTARLTRHDGEWELAHPLVVGPRYTPGAPTGAPAIGAGASPDTPRAPDASRVTPPRDRGAQLGFAVTATLHDAGAVSSPTHTLRLTTGDQTVVAAIDDPRGDRELVLRWRRAGLGPVRAVAEPTATGAYVAVLVEPPPTAAPPRRAARSWLVAIDRSASMEGASAAAARRLAHAVVASLGAGDRVAVVAVGERPSWLGATPAERARADRAIDRLRASGGDLTAGLAASLAGLPSSPPPAVVLVTDGLVADDAAAIARATAAGAVVHPIGVGAAPNRWLLEAIAAGSGGSAHVVIDPDDAEAIAAEVVAAAVATPVEIDWRRPSVIDVEPARAVVVPGGAALIVAVDPSWSTGGRAAEVEVLVGGQKVVAPIEVVEGSELATEWARQRVTRLVATGQREAATRLALERGLVSATTALVAVAPTAGDVVRSTVTVPLPLPAGQRPESVTTGSGDVVETTQVFSDSLVTKTKADDAGVDGTQDKAGIRRPTKKPATATTASPPPPPPPADVQNQAVEAERDDAGDDEDDDRSATAESPSPAPAAHDRAYALGGATMAADAAESVVISRGGGRGLRFTLGLGARVDEAAPVGQLSIGWARRLAATRFASGLRLELSGAPSAEHPVSAALGLTLARALVGGLALELDLGPFFDGRVGLGYGAGLSFGRGPLALGLRVSGAVTRDADPAAITGGVTVGF